jgi:hypothetical protein
MAFYHTNVCLNLAFSRSKIPYVSDERACMEGEPCNEEMRFFFLTRENLN